MLLKLWSLHFVHDLIKCPGDKGEGVLVKLQNLLYSGLLYLLVANDGLHGGVGVMGKQLVYGLDRHLVLLLLESGLNGEDLLID